MQENIYELAAQEHIDKLRKLKESGKEITVQQLEDIRKFFIFHKLHKESAVVKDLESLAVDVPSSVTAVKAPLHMEKDLPQKRMYLGSAGRTRLQVKFAYDHLFLSEPYFNRIVISWRFNEEGRIELIDGRIISKEKSSKANSIFHLLKTISSSTNKEWWKADADFHTLPEEVSCINEGFYAYDDEKQYQMLSNFGHGLADHLAVSLQRNLLSDPAFEMNEGQYPLSALKNDAITTGILQKARALTSKIKITKPFHGIFEYIPFKAIERNIYKRSVL